MKAIIVYGIPGCDTVKKTLSWLKNQEIPVKFHDYKKAGISTEKLVAWSNKVGWESLLNKKSSTWRNIPLTVQKKTINQQAAIKVMLANNSIIKRPVIEKGNELIVGFNEAEFIKRLKI